MGAYHIWHPSWVRKQPPTLETFVTLGEEFNLAKGNAAVVAKIARTVGVDEAPRSWAFACSRSHYFTSYYEDPHGWEDRWSLAWRITATFGVACPLTTMPASGFLDVDLKDPSYSDEDSPDNWAAWPCLVVADFRDQAALDAAKNVLARPGITGHTVGKAFDRYLQVRIDFGERPREWYEAGAHDAEQLLAVLRKAGASVRFNDTSAWLGGA